MPEEYRPDSSSALTVERVAKELRLVGQVGFWVKTVLAVVSTATLLVGISFSRVTAVPGGSSIPNAGRGPGIVLALCGLVALYGGCYWFLQYSLFAGRLRGKQDAPRPTRAETVQMLRVGLMINLLGMLLMIVAAEAIIGTIFIKSLAVQGSLAITAERYVNNFDVAIVQASVHTIAAHFSGLVGSLWLLNRVTR